MAYITGTAGNDTRTGTYLSDTIYGGLGNDLIRGLFGADYIYGDDYSFEIGDDRLYGGYNNDSIYGYGGNDRLYGESGDDYLVGGAGADVMSGGSGNDNVYLGSVADMNGDNANGDSGIDNLRIDWSASLVAVTFQITDHEVSKLISGGARIINFEKFDIAGSALADRLVGYLLNDSIAGGAGNDTISGGYGSDYLRGEDNDDALSGGGGNDQLYGGNGLDNLLGNSGMDDLYGDAGNDVLSGGNDIDDVHGGADNDTVNGGNDGDYMSGGTGADILKGDAGNDVLGSDWFIVYSAGNDTGAEIDNLDGGSGDDDLLIGVGDTGIGGIGTDIIRLSFAHTATAITYTLTQGLTTLANGTTISLFERLDFRGGSATDSVTGGNLQDSLHGGAGSDNLTGLGGDDWIEDGDGVDTTNAGSGNDLIFDGGGDDVHRGGADDDSIETGGGKDRYYGDAGADTFLIQQEGFEQPAQAEVDLFFGGTEIDTVVFDAYSISGVLDLADQTQNDGLILKDRFQDIEIFVGSYLDDVLLGDGTVNTFKGGSGDDVLDGRGGNDLLTGGTGSDIMTGGAGADSFFILANEVPFLSFDPAWRGDIITDFVRGTDKLHLELAGFGWANAAAVNLVVGANPTPALAAPTLLFETATNRLWFDKDGSGDNDGPVLIATLENVTNLSLADFVFV